MLPLIVKRIGYALIVIAGIVFVVSAMTRLVPGDPVDIMAAGNPGMTEADKARLRGQLGLDRPMVEQYLAYLGGALQGDLGLSLRQRVPAAQLILERLPATAELTFWAMLLSLLAAIPIGVATALRRDGPVDYAGTVVAVLGVSTPSFLLGILLILLFSVQLGWLPASGYKGSLVAAVPTALLDGRFDLLWQKARYFLLPSISLAFGLMAVNARLTRSAMIEALRQDYVQFARAKGLPPRAVTLRHALRNAIIPVVTMIGLQLGALLSGAIVIETVFAWPGIGRLSVQAITTRDYPLVQATVLIAAVLFVALNLIVDILYRVIDPRMRHG
ncbi:peptide/nickel transport system permease protein [Inquilinus ginsengisoli]|uniref:Peptide/nickel transport system permease protein n=1 Tax=Inquilinus ginsengisoli TaxID=363840 RepID=A0ABU1JZY1_9PROT|nr:ABC transporter permease [Inquilinus ginsengisoli]MDR6294182.1 peptide/nickel transport system permease protein [Inquilinus ginsengisoli]